MVQQFSLSTQWELHEGWLLDLGYVGRARHAPAAVSFSQPGSECFSVGAPFNGVTTNTLANVGQRVPIPGYVPTHSREMESAGNSWYNGLEASLTKRFTHGIQLLASYTFSKTLDTDGADINSTSVKQRTHTRRPKLSLTAMGPGQFRSYPPLRVQHNVDPSKPASRRVTSRPGRLVCSCNSNHSVRQRSHDRRHKFH